MWQTSPPLDTSDPQRCGALHENGTVASVPVVGGEPRYHPFSKSCGLSSRDGFGVFCSQIGAGTLPMGSFFFPDLVFSVPGISSDSGIPKNSRVSKMKVPEVLIDFAASEKKRLSSSPFIQLRRAQGVKTAPLQVGFIHPSYQFVRPFLGGAHLVVLVGRETARRIHWSTVYLHLRWFLFLIILHV